MERDYLRSVMLDCEQLGWLDQVNHRNKITNHRPKRLSFTYTPLCVESGKSSDRPTMTPLEVLNEQPFLVITGKAGSGKTATCNYICLCMAGEILNDCYYNLDKLTEPFPDRHRIPNAESQRWIYGALIPVRISLNDFSQSGYCPKESVKLSSGNITDFIKNNLECDNFGEYIGELFRRVDDRKIIVLFDGLDEITSRQERLIVIQCILMFARRYQDIPLIVTSRPFAFDDSEWNACEMLKVQLKHFNEGQTRFFVQKWYKNCTKYELGEANRRADILCKLIRTRPELQDMTKRPLLLSLTTFLHCNNLELPKQRAQLYERVVELLIDKWDSSHYPSTATAVERNSLRNELGIDTSILRLILERVSFAAHCAQDTNGLGASNIEERDLTQELQSAIQEISKEDVLIPNTNELAMLLQDRIGILHKRRQGSNGAVYAFPHRVIQEYLAASYLVRAEERLFNQENIFGSHCKLGHKRYQYLLWQDLANILLCSDPERWREVIFLAGSIQAYKKIPEVWQLINVLVSEPRDPSEITINNAWETLVASEIIIAERYQIFSGVTLSRHEKRILYKLRKYLPIGLTDGYLSLNNRKIIGKNLGKLIDTRKEVMEVDSMQFCMVPKGAFIFDRALKVKHNMDTERLFKIQYDYWLSRYPVSVAQFEQFKLETDGIEQSEEVSSPPKNMPIVLISKNDADSFCEWLTERWQKKDFLPKNLVVALPSEAEWEYCARGGEMIPDSTNMKIAPIAKLTGLMAHKMSLQENPYPRRVYPWGDASPSEDHLNTAHQINDQKIDGENTVIGMFPKGKSPYGCEEMSGSVQEWTRSLYELKEGRGFVDINQMKTKKFVARGGSFQWTKESAKCTDDGHQHVDVTKTNYLGLRLALTPNP